ncbi:MAG: PDZ domain-containing protein, partial [Bdellovibrionaceae bacterium]|nr:PDZ domain-containing protein [Pseudobdellovibrionaceae bacterium]
LYLYKFEDGSNEVVQKTTRFVTQNLHKTHVLTFDDTKLRLFDAKAKPTAESKVGKKDGYLDTARLKVKINPKQEWQQMYHEAWVLQKEHFWVQDMSKVNWDLVYKRYQSLLSKVKTRSELSDLIWEMQGELGTSHSYELLGDYDRRGTEVLLGKLGAYFSFNTKTKNFQIERLLNGDSWISSASSPLTGMGVSLKAGDQIVAVDGVGFERGSDLYRLLENKADQKVELDIVRKGRAQTEKVIVKAGRSLAGAWYRDWVEANRKYVHEKSNGKIGYVHVPDMGTEGFAEFYRSFNQEHDYEALVIDVRYNGGGHVSQHLLKVLAQKVLGFDETRYQGLMKYPMYAPGALVAVCN